MLPRLDALTPRFVPDTITRPLEHGILYISEKYGASIHLCACGCDQLTVLPFQEVMNDRGWRYTRYDDGTVSFSPSISNAGFCPNKAHYFIERNRVRWC